MYDKLDKKELAELFINAETAGDAESRIGAAYDVSERTVRNWKNSLILQGYLKKNPPYSVHEVVEEFSDTVKDKVFNGLAPGDKGLVSSDEPITEEVMGECKVSRAELLKLMNIHKVKKDVAKILGVSKHFVNKACEAFNIISERDQVDILLDIMNSSSKYIEPYVSIPKQTDVSPDHFNMAIGDMHTGKKIIRPDNTFNLEVLVERMDKITENGIDILNQRVSMGTKIGFVNIFGVGDLVDGSGNVYKGQPYNQVASFPDQVIYTYNALIKLIKSFHSEGFPVRFIAAPGNHGQTGDNPENNFDILVYKMIENWRNQNKIDNLEIAYSTNVEYIDYKIGPWNFHIRHKAFSQASTSSGRAKFLGWSRIHENADLILCGHFHNPMYCTVGGSTVLMNGCVCGNDDFSDTLAVQAHPCQIIWGTSNKRQMTFYYPVDLL